MSADIMIASVNTPTVSELHAETERRLTAERDSLRGSAARPSPFAPTTHELSVEEIRQHAEEAARACDRHTPPNGLITVAAMDRAIGLARSGASTPDQIAAVKTAREAVRAYERSGADYAGTLAIVVALEPMARQARVTLPAIEKVDPTVYFVPSSTTSGVYYRVLGNSCTCRAGQLGHRCKHVEAVKVGGGWAAMPQLQRAAEPAAPMYPRNADEAFERVERGARNGR